MGKGNHSQSKEKKKPKKAQAPKAIPVKTVRPSSREVGTPSPEDVDAGVE